MRSLLRLRRFISPYWSQVLLALGALVLMTAISLAIPLTNLATGQFRAGELDESEQLYREALTHADRMILTEVDCAPAADTWFPEWDEEGWDRLSVRRERADEKNPFDYCVIELTRRPAGDGTCPEPGKAADPRA